MDYRRCSSCGAIIDGDEPKCLSCGKNLLNNEIIAYEELISQIQKGEIPLSKVWTKSPHKISQVLESLPT